MGNRLGFGLGTLGRDGLAAMVSMFLMFYLTDVLEISGAQFAMVSAIMVAMRAFDAINDPFMGVVVDNTRSKWGKFKPWILIGAVAWAGSSLLMFADFGVRGWGYVVLFTVVYLVYEISYTINDISFWSMLPSLTDDQAERERIGAVARIFANIGLFAVVVGILPVTSALTEVLGSDEAAWFAVVCVLAALMLAFQSLTLLFAREQVNAPQEHTRLRELFGVIGRNDQLLWVTLAMVAFMTGYGITTSLGVYYFKYIVGNEGAYSIFAAILAVAQITALICFPAISKRLRRGQIHLLASTLMTVGYLVFLFAGTSLVITGVAGVLLFTGQGMIQLLMVMFIADSVEYGEWKLGRRNESITFSLQPFIYKLSNAFAVAVVSITVLATGIDTAKSAADVGTGSAWLFRVSMMVAPMLLVIASYLVMRAKYVIDEDRYAQILADLTIRRSGG
ncbi:lactose/raffinose/galactose permease [Tessaracoccus bendigoensis DSM 12906]|uniref:Lactose/raffinose/galactose permease n=1 Tax=Tessaracoccus bendigoensis DSM 12906 TaxID=1123357 RepID=A0A1M6IC54_9ACTN|nr:glycoside-pentoside-hexuronide (GPH):cation symporter [Tessaracoccus bendigoensis]SHJ32018.1 lactose/raffinose/galactose permease [Tessaracoccus bendigoensis DSM 12906]